MWNVIAHHTDGSEHTIAVADQDSAIEMSAAVLNLPMCSAAYVKYTA